MTLLPGLAGAIKTSNRQIIRRFGACARVALQLRMPRDLHHSESMKYWLSKPDFSSFVFPVYPLHIIVF